MLYAKDTIKGSGVSVWAKAQSELFLAWTAFDLDMSKARTSESYIGPLLKYVAISLAVFIYAVLLIPLIAL